jgi:hypothetical protein
MMAWALLLLTAGLAAVETPVTCTFGGRDILAARQRALAGDPALADMLKRVRRDAERALGEPLRAVTDKPQTPPSGDKHDYLSLATYYWPDPTKPDGLPYISRDGEVNPEIRQYDHDRLNGMASAVRVMALGWWLTDEPKYAERAARQLRVFFLDEATRMNPHLRHGQMVKGRNEGAPYGIIDTHRLPQMLDGVALLTAGGRWPAEDQQRLRQWFADYLTWLRTSDLGKREGAGTNNHGVWYDVQTACFALFTGEQALARQIVEEAKDKRIARQIEPDGSQPRELARTRSLSYTMFNLSAFCQLARLGDLVGVDLWNYQTPDGRGLRRALDWVLPYALGEKTWTTKQITDETYAPLLPVLRQFGLACREPAYEAALARIADPKNERSRVDLFFPRPPA